jgi:hypothetical protein
MDAVTDNFNSLMEDTILLFLDEATWGGSKSASGKLKSLVTEEPLCIEHKGVNKYEAKNWIRMCVSSNADWVVPAESDERRYTVFNTSATYQKNREHFRMALDGEIGAYLDEVLNHTITSDLKVNLDTDALHDQQELGLSVQQEFWNDGIANNWFWTADGAGRQIPHSELEERFLTDYARRYDANGLTAGAFVKRFKRMLTKTLDIPITAGKKVPIPCAPGVNAGRVNGLQLPHFRKCNLTARQLAALCAVIGL